MHIETDFKNLNKFISDLFNSPEDNPDKETTSLRYLIEETRSSLAVENFPIGEWEELELDQSHILLDAGLSRLAMISVIKAIAIYNLSVEEYTFGLSIVRRQTGAVSKMDASRAAAITTRHETAQDLTAAESMVAAHLDRVQEETARRLLDRQLKTASELEKKNSHDAYELLLAQEKAMESLQEGERKIVSHMRDLEQTLSWMGGGYVDQIMPSGSVFDDIYRSIQETQKETALTLKKHQEMIAFNLKKHQKQLAESLKMTEKSEALHLATEQKVAATHLKEAQTLKEIKKEYKDTDS